MATGTAVPFRLPEQPSETDLVAKYFRAMSDPTRVAILELLAQDEHSVGELVAALGEPQPKISNHLACLRWCGFVETRREHRTIHYRVTDTRVLDLLEIARALLADNEEHVASCRRIDANGC
ncbi:MAG: metalloregulator ArsR/SmtB family transcription factor [Thermoleophilaceae bacterium]